jgi:hypothetical protein
VAGRRAGFEMVVAHRGILSVGRRAVRAGGAAAADNFRQNALE